MPQAVARGLRAQMVQYDLDEARAFQYLARVSQNTNRKVRDVAVEVVADVNARNRLTE
ncbi:ANTAR domain-containing protein [Pedococcus sp. 5OH_020]|uniref:ANTAR domain-containing protein n=1 Tax=Pedococcus sp. 5OH_020 TaxID=2989814 RepID=UPI0022EA0547|nr:ANTAR domain-containing protein [Pedococcus sp. 5OH_020]